MQEEAARLVLRLPMPLNVAGCDGTMHSLCMRGGTKVNLCAQWWSDYPAEMEEAVRYAERWKERLMSLKWQERK